MKRGTRILVSLFAFFIATTLAQVKPAPAPPGEKVIAEELVPCSAPECRQGKVSLTTRCVLTVDGDDVVKDYCRREYADRAPERWERYVMQIGTLLHSSGGLDLLKFLPPEKAPVAARRVTLARGTILHIVQAWGYAPSEALPHYSLYALLQRAGSDKAEISWRKENIGPRSARFTVADFNDDSKMYILDVMGPVGSGGVECLTLYRIAPNGGIVELQNMNGTMFSLEEKGPAFKSAGLVAFDVMNASERESCREPSISYKWSDKDQKFIRAHK